jgi:glucans biosynthesis protein C
MGAQAYHHNGRGSPRDPVAASPGPVTSGLPAATPDRSHRSATVRPPHGRLHGLDALRGGALLLGILLHSLMPFHPESGWFIADAQTAGAVDEIAYVIHLFRMTLFMLLAGFFGNLVLQRRGPTAFVRERATRILLPAIAFWPVAVILPLAILVPLDAARRDLPPAPPPEDVPLLLALSPLVLWFLWTLMQCVVIVVVARALLIRAISAERLGRAASAAGRVLTRPGGVLLAAVPYATGLVIQGRFLSGLREPQTVLPEWSSLIPYLGAFLTGWLLFAHRGGLQRLAGQWPAHLVAALVLTVGAAPGLPVDRPVPLAAALTALAGWTWVYALLGVCMRFLTRERPALRYLADSSYWMYLMHLPLLLLCELFLADLDWPIAIKLLLTLGLCVVLLLVSYHLLVRSTWLGGWLNGRRVPFCWGPLRSVPPTPNP